MKHLLMELLDIDYPVFQAPMAGALTSPDFIAQISNFGMLGSIASGYLSLQQVDSFINKVQALTTAPFLGKFGRRHERQVYLS